MVDGIKPPSGDRPLSDDAASSSVEKSKGREFSLLRGKAGESTSAARTQLAALEGYRKADLDDPQKLNSIVRASVAELIDGGCATLGPVPQHDRERVLDFLADSPFIQQQLQSYLSKVLS